MTITKEDAYTSYKIAADKLWKETPKITREIVHTNADGKFVAQSRYSNCYPNQVQGAEVITWAGTITNYRAKTMPIGAEKLGGMFKYYASESECIAACHEQAKKHFGAAAV